MMQPKNFQSVVTIIEEKKFFFSLKWLSVVAIEDHC